MDRHWYILVLAATVCRTGGLDTTQCAVLHTPAQYIGVAPTHAGETVLK